MEVPKTIRTNKKFGPAKIAIARPHCHLCACKSVFEVMVGILDVLSSVEVSSHSVEVSSHSVEVSSHSVEVSSCSALPPDDVVVKLVLVENWPPNMSLQSLL